MPVAPPLRSWRGRSPLRAAVAALPLAPNQARQEKPRRYANKRRRRLAGEGGGFIMGPKERARLRPAGLMRAAGWALVVVFTIWPASAAARARISVGGPAADRAWFGDTQDSASAALGDGTTIDLFYGAPMLPEAWYDRDRSELTALLGSQRATPALLYNQWLAIADLRAAIYAAGGQLEPGGLLVYPQGPSAVVHALDLALWAREGALLWVLGDEPLSPYPDFADLGYRDPEAYLGSTRQASTLQPADVGSVMNDLLLPSSLFAGDRVMLMPYAMPQEYGLTDVIGPDIRVWLGADADIDLRHVLAHELGHAIHFRYGGYDSTVSASGATQPLSTFWQQYLTLRGLSWQDPSQAPWKLQTPECFAEDVASIVTGPGDLLGYQTTGCPAPTTSQQIALLAWLRSLPLSGAAPSPFQQAEWVDWQAPWPSADFGMFQAMLFTAAPQVNISVALDAQASGGPYTVDVEGQSTPLATLAPGGAWSGTVPVPDANPLVLDVDSPALYLSTLNVYRNPQFVPDPHISGVFPDTLDSWARADIAAAVRAGIVGGYPDGMFRPDGAVTRAEFARMLATALLARLLSGPASGSPGRTWTDVAPGSWEAPFVTAVGAMLPGTTPGGAFAPDRPLTRQEAAAWESAAFGWAGLTPDRAAAILATYPDGGAVAPQDAPAFAAALSRGLIAGDAGTGALRPTDTINRAEAAVLVLRAVNQSAGQ